MSPLPLRSALKPPGLHLDGALLSFHNHSSVCGSWAKSRAPCGEQRHLRFDINMMAGTQTVCTEMMMMVVFVFVP